MWWSSLWQDGFSLKRTLFDSFRSVHLFDLDRRKSPRSCSRELRTFRITAHQGGSGRVNALRNGERGRTGWPGSSGAGRGNGSRRSVWVQSAVVLKLEEMTSVWDRLFSGASHKPGQKGEMLIIGREKILPKMAYLVQKSQWWSGEHMFPGSPV